MTHGDFQIQSFSLGQKGVHGRFGIRLKVEVFLDKEKWRRF